jgi:predicted RNase H-like HicB family nuclease
MISCDEGGYTAVVPSLSGGISEGVSVDETLANIKEATELYLCPDNRMEIEGYIVKEAQW